MVVVDELVALMVHSGFEDVQPRLMSDAQMNDYPRLFDTDCDISTAGGVTKRNEELRQW